MRICLVCIRRDSVKLGDIETRVSHEAVPSKHDAQLLQHLTADLKQDSRSARRASVRVIAFMCFFQDIGNRSQCSGTCTRAGDPRHSQG